MNVVQEEKRASQLLTGKIVARILRPRPKEVVIEFTDGARLFIDRTDQDLELSITGGNENSASL